MNKINLNQQTQKKKQDEKQKIIVMEIVEITNIVEIKHLFLSFYLP